MIAVYDPATGIVREIVESLGGVDMTGMESIATPQGFNPAKPSHVLQSGVWVVNTAPAWAALRTERDRLLRWCDWTQLTTARLTVPQRAAWDAYRDALFDLPENTTDPENPVWPTPPQ